MRPQRIASLLAGGTEILHGLGLADRIVAIQELNQEGKRVQVTPANFLDWRARQKSFTAIGAGRSQGFDYIGASEAERVAGAMVSHDLFLALRHQDHAARITHLCHEELANEPRTQRRVERRRQVVGVEAHDGLHVGGTRAADQDHQHDGSGRPRPPPGSHRRRVRLRRRVSRGAASTSSASRSTRTACAWTRSPPRSQTARRAVCSRR